MELYTAHFYEHAIKLASDDVWIPLEQINGPILFLTAQKDSFCPSSLFAKIASERLTAKGFSYSHKHINYEYASHFLVPIEKPESIPVKATKVERKYQQECAKSRIDSLHKTIEWLKKW